MSAVKASSYDALIAAAARTSEDVEISGGGTVSVRGLSVIEFLQILRRFPEVRDLLLSTIGGLQADDLDLKMQLLESLVGTGPEVIAALIAAAAGHPRDEAFEGALLNLADEDFLALLERVIALTMPGGISDFFGRFAAVAARLGLSVGRDPDPQSAEAA